MANEIHIFIHQKSRDRKYRDQGEFKESDHPRANNGQFGSGGGSSSGGGLTAERGRFEWEIKNEKGQVVGKYPTSLSKKEVLEEHEKSVASKKAENENKKASAKQNAEKRLKKADAISSLNAVFKEKSDLISNAHHHKNLSFKPMSREEFSSQETLPIYKSGAYGSKAGSEYRLVMVNGKPAYARESDHWGQFHTSAFVNGEKEDVDHNWELPGAKTGYGNKERMAGYILLEDLEKLNAK